MNSRRVAIAICGTFLLYLAVRVSMYVYFNEYLKDERGNPIPPLLLIAGILTIRLAFVESNEALNLRINKAFQFGTYGAIAIVTLALAALLIFTLPPQGGLWLVFGGPFGFVLGAVVGLLLPQGK